MTQQTSNNIHNDRILILDFGSQYTQLIARRVREIGVYCEVHPWDACESSVRAFQAKGIILSGSPESTTQDEPPYIQDFILELNLPILGICYGMQSLCAQLGGSVASSEKREFGHAQLHLTKGSRLFSILENNFDQLNVWMSHGDKVTEAPNGFKTIAYTQNAPLAAIEHVDKPWFGLQFHPEVTHTECGKQILSHFALNICQCSAQWCTHNIIEDSIQSVRQQVGDQSVILGLSGGVDSSVVAALLHRAIGSQLTCVFVDTGLLRHEEGDQVMSTFAEHMGIRVIRVNAEQRFFDALKGVTDPEKKRKIIGHLFIEIFDEQAAQCQDATFLAQGTIYPDVIESAGSKTAKAHVIKAHHNVGGLPEDMTLKLLEPLRELFKDEVRRMGLELGLPHAMVYRHPFPGPGLGVRILGEVKQEFANILRLADHIFIEELVNAGLYEKTAQAFAVFLPVKSVGVVGDARQYEYVIALRAVETIDFMTARWAPLPYDFLDHVSRRINNEVQGVSRVVYDISGKPPATIEWE